MRNQRGAASILAVTFASFLIVVIVTLMVNMMVGELRQSTDAASSSKAYYAAESGAEEAVLRIRQDLASGNVLPNQNCVDPDQVAATIQGVVCRTIRTSGERIEGDVDSDSAKQYEIPDGVSSLSVTWDKEGGTIYSNDYPAIPQNVPPWPGSAPPPIELTALTFADGNPSSLVQRKMVLWPCQMGGCATGSRNFANGIMYTRCTSSGAATDSTLRCNLNLNNLRATPGHHLVMRIRPLYVNSVYTLVGFSGPSATGAPINLKMVNAEVDVTARIGDAFRRVTVEVPILSQPVEGNVSVQGDEDICKTFDIISNATNPIFVDKTPENKFWCRP